MPYKKTSDQLRNHLTSTSPKILSATFFYDVKNAPLWNVYKRNHSGHSSAEACSGVSSRQASKNIPEAMVKETVLSNHDNVTIINELLPTSSAMHQEESTA
ncbi:YNL034W-like protein, partial [Saccharomyces cerevisiae Vin13]